MNSLGKITVVFLAAAAALFVLPVRQDSAPVAAQPVSMTSVQHLDGCPIRLLSTGPVLLRDSAHHCSDNFTSVTVNDDGDLDVAYQVQGKIVTVIAAQDETLAKRDVHPGASVALDHMLISFGRNQVHYSALSSVVTGPSSNVWLWVVTVEEIASPSPSPTS